MKDNLSIVKDTYNEIAHEFKPMLQEENSSCDEVEFMNDFLSRIPSNGEIVDLGCGVGKHGRYCASKGFSVTGYDFSEKMIELAKKNNDLYTIEFLQIADIRFIESDKCFDGVVAMYSLIHLTEAQTHQTLQNITKYLKPNAYLVLTVYFGDKERYTPEFLSKLGKLQYYKDYLPNQIKATVESEGFTVEKLRLWNDGDEITGGNEEYDAKVIGLICKWNG